ncbi:hypothetical protein [Streptomyces sp. H27-C3]|uniref:hypothetical protein n=1 Tax=Streptomyces sp. H27-C3 TaxID=3046305 RepID=UPI0024BAE5B4|nr:hypothetical protein [Streptomyces sp. H27-C3]MDJ0463646.1 hypothetical protein [Streptomyces sp. H27-C3]
MKITVAPHKLFGRRDIVREAKYLAPLAARIVERSVPGRMPRVQVTVTTPRGLAELATSAETALVGDVDDRVRARALADANRHARGAAGRAVALPDGGVLLLLNAHQHRTADDVAVTLVHELTHAMQYSRPGVRERMIRDLRDGFGIEPQSRREDRESARRLRAEEKEAYRAEHLASQLTRTAA